MNETLRASLSSKLPCAADKIDFFLSEPSAQVGEALATQPGDIMVLGAGGKMGLHLCLMLKRALVEIGDNRKLLAVSRFGSVNDRKTFEDNGIVTQAADLTDPAALAALPEAANIFFMAGAKFGTAGNPGLLKLMNEDLPRNVVRRFPQSRFTAFSTGCVYAFTIPANGGSLETDPTDPPGEYARSCLGRENAFTEAARDHGTPSVLIRLNYSVEFRYGVLLDIGQKVLAGEAIDLSMGYVNLIWQRDAVDQIIRAMTLAAAPAVPLNVTGPDVLAIEDLARRFGQLFGVEPRFTGEPAETAWLNNPAKSHGLFGQPPTSVDTMVEWVAAWLAQGGKTLGKPTGFEKRDGKF